MEWRVEIEHDVLIERFILNVQTFRLCCVALERVAVCFRHLQIIFDNKNRGRALLGVKLDDLKSASASLYSRMLFN